jgi:hypothetical protein
MKNYTVNVVRLIGAGLLLLTLVLEAAFMPHPTSDTDRIILALLLCFCFLIFALAFEVKQD